MYITYHKEVPEHKDYFNLSHDVLDKEIRLFLLNRDVAQNYYKVRDNGSSLFIYLSSGDRVDVQY